jgi:hypothetical protein
VASRPKTFGLPKAFGLRGPRDLLRKLERNVETLCSLETTDPDEMAFAAFDCAVTAYSLKDWCYHWVKETGQTKPGVADDDIYAVQNTAIHYLQICGELANGSKHFRLETRRDDPDVSSRVSAAPYYATAGEMRCGDPLADYGCVAKIDTPEGTLRAPFFFKAMLEGWRNFMDARQIDVR